MELKQCVDTLFAVKADLLIVPYGIETPKSCTDVWRWRTFNRTLWN